MNKNRDTRNLSNHWTTWPQCRLYGKHSKVSLIHCTMAVILTPDWRKEHCSAHPGAAALMSLQVLVGDLLISTVYPVILVDVNAALTRREYSIDKCSTMGATTVTPLEGNTISNGVIVMWITNIICQSTCGSDSCKQQTTDGQVTIAY